jgi:hypothetical protein
VKRRGEERRGHNICKERERRSKRTDILGTNTLSEDPDCASWFLPLCQYQKQTLNRKPNLPLVLSHVLLLPVLPSQGRSECTIRHCQNLFALARARARARVKVIEVSVNEPYLA